MNIFPLVRLKMVVLPYLFFIAFTGFTTVSHPDIVYTPQEVSINSHSFNAKKRSGFHVGALEESVSRGLTIIHFNSPDTFEHKNFDTYGSAEASVEMLEILKRLHDNKATFAILAHDSAVRGAFEQSKELTKMGFIKLGALIGRQAYIMHNIDGAIYEVVDDISASITVTLPSTLSDQEIYFPKIRYEYEPSNDRYIAHAGGEVNGIKSTNSKQALDQNYARGFRLFELDIIFTSDGKPVAAHDWKMWSRFTDYSGELPPSHAEFMKHKIYGDYTTLDMEGINAWFAAHPDATLITDKIKDPIVFADQFVDKSRLIMELFSPMAIEEAINNGVTPMISQAPLLKLKGDKLNYLSVNNIKHVAISRRIIANETKLLLQLKEQGVRVYVYNVNFDSGKDEQYVQENEIGLVYGMYADKWVFDEKNQGLTGNVFED